MITPLEILCNQNPFKKLENRIDALLQDTTYGDTCSVLLTCDEHKYAETMKRVYSPCWDVKIVEIGMNENIKIYLDFDVP